MIKLESIQDIINKYDNYIIDQWGVMHNGIVGFDYAINCINYLYKNGKNLFIISNSSKRQKFTQDKLSELGFEKNMFKKIITSGEMIWQNMKKEFSKYKETKKCFHIHDKTKKDGLAFRKGLNLSFVNNVADADIILACTPFSNMLPVDYIPILNNAVNKKIKMYCANPDYETTENNTDKKKFCMGAIAEIYTKMGGEVLILGKPEEEIYIKTFKYTKIDKSKTIAIGDSLFHDIKGANNFCVDSILVISGIHKDLKTIDKLSKSHQIAPTYVINNFSV